MEKKENLNKNYPSLLVPLDIAGKLKMMKKHNYSFDNNDLEAHYFDFSFPELYYEQLKEKA